MTKHAKNNNKGAVKEAFAFTIAKSPFPEGNYSYHKSAHTSNSRAEVSVCIRIAFDLVLH